MYGFIFFIIVLLGAYLAICWHFSSTLLFPKVSDHELALASELEKGRIENQYYSYFLSLQKETVAIKSDHGYDLHGLWIPNQDSDKTIVFCHGITWNLIGAIKYTEIFWNMGFNLLIYDHRKHGKSGGKSTTYGLFEKDDLKAWLDWIELKKGKGTYIATHGESLGAATVLQHLGIDSRVKFCVADCPYSDLKEILRYTLQMEHHLKKLPILPVANLFTKLRAGLSINEVSPIETIRKVQTPIFWIHGTEDRKVPSQMSVDMYEAKTQGIKKLWLVTGARHASACVMDRQGYTEQIEAFIQEVDHENH